uniref:Uncharacterized protein n=1 Tax=Setaria viridis TaxID=4556 RepID=A0A4U6TZ95_SETVI|nr:hypothetical protein SEVIR_7G004600v2 [Setaria viridis]
MRRKARSCAARHARSSSACSDQAAPRRWRRPRLSRRPPWRAPGAPGRTPPPARARPPGTRASAPGTARTPACISLSFLSWPERIDATNTRTNACVWNALGCGPVDTWYSQQ